MTVMTRIDDFFKGPILKYFWWRFYDQNPADGGCLALIAAILMVSTAILNFPVIVPLICTLLMILFISLVTWRYYYDSWIEPLFDLIRNKFRKSE